MLARTSGLPKFSTGLNPVRASFTQGRRVPCGRLMEETTDGWSSEYVSHAPVPARLTMSDLGYREEELGHRNGVLDDTALVAPVRLLTPEGSRIVANACRRLEPHARTSSFIISRRFRGADLVCPFLFNMVRDRRFLKRVSRIAGVPLIPHPVRKGTGQINYYNAEASQCDEIGKWHTDGMDYVFTVLLSDPSDFEGGQFSYFAGRKDRFNGEARSGSRVHAAPLCDLGDTIFARGSQIYHGVSPVTRGRRMVLTLSFFCPAFADRDSNSFAHVAADDGIPQTLRDWLRLKWPTRHPFRDYALRVGSPIITWRDVERDRAPSAR